MKFFHSTDHLYFVRHDNGDVSIVKSNEELPWSSDDAAVKAAMEKSPMNIRLTGDVWVSIMASMSPDGGLSDSYDKAKALHGKS